MKSKQHLEADGLPENKKTEIGNKKKEIRKKNKKKGIRYRVTFLTGKRESPSQSLRDLHFLC